MHAQEISKGLIYLTTHGSRAYGLNTPESDWDVKGVCIPPKEYFFSPFKYFEQFEDREAIASLVRSIKPDIPADADIEGTIYDIRKFFKLAADCNPNMIDILHVPEDQILYISPLGQRLRSQAQLFLSKKARHTFTGYAMAQLKRIRGHYERITNPPIEPIQEAYIIEKATPSGTKYLHFNEQEYKAAKKKYQQYLTWRRDRNPERAKLEEAYTYDTKHGNVN